MPKVIPQPVDLPIGSQPWAREITTFGQETRIELDRLTLDVNNSFKGVASSLNFLSEQLGNVQAGINGMIANATFAATQVTSGIFSSARIPTQDASKISGGALSVATIVTTGTIGAGGHITSSGDIAAAGYLVGNSSWNYDVGAITRKAVWMDSSGKMGFASSSKRFKKDIEKWSPEEQAVLALEVVRFHWKDAEKGTHWEVGVIAEQLDQLGLKWLVCYEDDGVTPNSVHYDRLALALLPVIQKQNTRLNALEERIIALETKS